MNQQKKSVSDSVTEFIVARPYLIFPAFIIIFSIILGIINTSYTTDYSDSNSESKPRKCFYPGCDTIVSDGFEYAGEYWCFKHYLQWVYD